MSDYAIGGRVRRPLELPDASIAGRTGRATRRLGRGRARPGRVVPPRGHGAQRGRAQLPDLLPGRARVEQARRRARGDRARPTTWPSNEADSRFAPDGRVVEVLAEHLCEGFLEGYLKTGRHGLFPCYEAFIQIVDSKIAPVRQVAEGLAGDRLAPAARVAQHPAHVRTRGGRTTTATRTRTRASSTACSPRRGHVLRITLPPDANTLTRDRRALPALHRLHQPRHRHQAAAAAVAVDGRGEGARRRGRIDLALGVAPTRASTPTWSWPRPGWSRRTRRWRRSTCSRRTCRTCGSASSTSWT